MCPEIHIARTGPIPAPAPWATVHRLMAGVRRCSAFSIWVTFRALGSPEAGALAIPGGYSPRCLLGPWPTCPYLNMPGRPPPQGLRTDCSSRLIVLPPGVRIVITLSPPSALCSGVPFPSTPLLAILPSSSFLHSTSYHLLCFYLILSVSYLLPDYKPLEGRIFFFCSLFMFLVSSAVLDT